MGQGSFSLWRGLVGLVLKSCTVTIAPQGCFWGTGSTVQHSAAALVHICDHRCRARGWLQVYWQNSKGQIRGMWFYDLGELYQISHSMQQ